MKTHKAIGSLARAVGSEDRFEILIYPGSRQQGVALSIPRLSWHLSDAHIAGPIRMPLTDAPTGGKPRAQASGIDIQPADGRRPLSEFEMGYQHMSRVRRQQADELVWVARLPCRPGGTPGAPSCTEVFQSLSFAIDAVQPSRRGLAVRGIGVRHRPTQEQSFCVGPLNRRQSHLSHRKLDQPFGFAPHNPAHEQALRVVVRIYERDVLAGRRKSRLTDGRIFEKGFQRNGCLGHRHGTNGHQLYCKRAKESHAKHHRLRVSANLRSKPVLSQENPRRPVQLCSVPPRPSAQSHT